MSDIKTVTYDLNFLTGGINLTQGDIAPLNMNGIIHVDKGAHATDTRGTFSKYSIIRPFATIQAAINAAIAGDLIWVHSGTYVETLIFKHLVDVYFDSGAKNIYTVTADGQKFFTDMGDSTYRVLGHGQFEFILTPETYSGCFAIEVNNGSNFEFNGLSFKVTNYDGSQGFIQMDSPCTLTLNVPVTDTKLFMADPSAIVNVNADFTNSVDCCVDNDGSGGTINLNANMISSNAVALTFGSNMTLNANNVSIASVNGSAIQFNTSINATIKLNDCDLNVVSDYENSCIDTWHSNTGITIEAYNCTFKPSSTATSAIVAGDAINVSVAHCRSTKPIEGANVTNLIKSPCNVIDANV